MIVSSCAVQSFGGYQSRPVNTRSNPAYGAANHDYMYKPGDLVVNTKTNTVFKIDSVQYRKTGLKNINGYFYYATDMLTGEHVKGLLEKALMFKQISKPRVDPAANMATN